MNESPRELSSKCREQVPGRRRDIRPRFSERPKSVFSYVKRSRSAAAPEQERAQGKAGKRCRGQFSPVVQSYEAGFGVGNFDETDRRRVDSASAAFALIGIGRIV